MFAKLLSPSDLIPASLDEYLENGWFRMGQSIFTTHFLCFKHQFYSAIWLRIDLKKTSRDNTLAKLSKQNARFRVEFRKASVNKEKEELFLRYKQSISFDTSESVQHLLNRYQTPSIFETMEVVLYDEEKLIGVGYFDVGESSAAGIASIYDPDYRKHSLGKYLIYLKLAYCQLHDFRYFYPGYFAPGYPAFDYKLHMCEDLLSFFELKTQSWKELSSFDPVKNPLQVMKEKLEELQKTLTDASILSDLLYYDFFDANLIPNLKGFELFDYPLFLYCRMTEDVVQPIIVYDTLDDKYHLLQCNRVWTPEEVVTVSDHYNTHLLKLREDLFCTNNPHEIKVVLLSAIKDEIEN